MCVQTEQQPRLLPRFSGATLPLKWLGRPSNDVALQDLTRPVGDLFEGVLGEVLPSPSGPQPLALDVALLVADDPRDRLRPASARRRPILQTGADRVARRTVQRREAQIYAAGTPRVLIMLSFALSCGLTVAAAAPPPGNTGASRPRGPIDWISWSPGPKILLDAGNANLAISGGGATRRLFPPSGFENPVWAPSGRLLAARSDKGVVVAFPTGKPLRRVARSGHFPSWSPTGSTLAFQTFGSPGPGAIWTVGVDGRRKRQLVTTLRLGPDFDRGPVWSPDGRRLAFGACLRRVPEGQGCGGLRRGIGVFTIRVDGTGRRRVAYGSCPDWSPGRRIALSTDMGIALVNGDGSGRRIVASRPVSCPVWSPNGRSVAAEGARSLLVVASGARRARRVGKLPALPTCCDYPHPPAPAWSPDGTQIAVVRAVEDGSARLAYRLYVVRVDDGHTRLILMTPYSYP
jgi:hypothetical protein